MSNRKGLSRRLLRAFILQAAFIGMAVIVGVLAARFFLEDVLIERALQGEAAYFWERSQDDASFPLPDTRNMSAYLDVEGGGLPAELRDLKPGIQRVAGATDSLVYVSEHNGERLVLVFDEARVDELVTVFGLVPLAAVLIVIYLALYWAYRTSRRAVSPVIALAEKVQLLDPGAPDFSAFDPRHVPADADEEIRLLSAAIHRFAERLASFVDRERNFTRDASHELRSPLTVIRLAADMLESEQELPPQARASVRRIRQAARDMEELTDAFLLLARESGQGLPMDDVCVNDLVSQEIERVRMVAADKPVEISSSGNCRMLVSAPEKVLASVIGNLLRNAYSYTDTGSVQAVIEAGVVRITDSGRGMAANDIEKIFQPFFRGQRQRGGHGVGLTIVKRLCDRFRWQVEIESEPGVGTTVTVRFPDARSEALPQPQGLSKISSS